ncbi:hypothetical protein NL154_03375 [Rhizobium sp. YTUHZ044]|uniref:hypothetical protein n=1 Tax=Rhizobium sp. YTUHZ044 TaxID=2962678 RepID=UPI003DA832C7
MEERGSERDRDIAGARAATLIRSALRRGFQIWRLRSKRVFAGMSFPQGSLHALCAWRWKRGAEPVSAFRGSPQSRVAGAESDDQQSKRTKFFRLVRAADHPESNWEEVGALREQRELSHGISSSF